jgi:imidazolonepropionase-like amidohydrolase
MRDRGYLRNAVTAALFVGAAIHSAKAQQPTATPPKITVIHAGELLAVPGEAPRKEVTVVVENERIARVEQGYVAPETLGLAAGVSPQVVDLKDHFVLPGLMDAHVHLQYRNVYSPREASLHDGKTIAERTLIALKSAQQTLVSGFTTVRDVGSDHESVFAVRNEINAGRIMGPRILVSGPSVSVTAGHGDPIVDGKNADPENYGVCDGPDDCRRATRRIIRMGADLIKMQSTGGFSDNTGLAQHMDPDEMAAVIHTSHQRGLKVATHAYDPEAIKDALRAGVDSIEHGMLMDDEGIELMKEKGAYFVPTLLASMPPKFVRAMLPPEAITSRQLRDQYKAFERAYAAGANIAFGTDTGTSNHGENWEEFSMMVEFGMSEMDAIRSATVMTARLFGIEADAGTIEAGKLGDIIAVPSSPLDDIDILGKVDFVMKSGKLVRLGDEFSYPLPGL